MFSYTSLWRLKDFAINYGYGGTNPLEQIKQTRNSASPLLHPTSLSRWNTSVFTNTPTCPLGNVCSPLLILASSSTQFVELAQGFLTVV